MNWRRYIGWTFLGSFGFMILWVIASFAEMFIPLDLEKIYPAIRLDHEITSVMSGISMIHLDGVKLSREGEMTGFSENLNIAIIAVTRTDESICSFYESENGILRYPDFNLDEYWAHNDQTNPTWGIGRVRPNPIDHNIQYPATRRKLSRLIERSIMDTRSKSLVWYGSLNHPTWSDAIMIADHPLVKTRFYLRMIYEKIRDELH